MFCVIETNTQVEGICILRGDPCLWGRQGHMKKRMVSAVKTAYQLKLNSLFIIILYIFGQANLYFHCFAVTEDFEG